jgi:hypothetical protein
MATFFRGGSVVETSRSKCSAGAIGEKHPLKIRTRRTPFSKNVTFLLIVAHIAQLMAWFRNLAGALTRSLEESERQRQFAVRQKYNRRPTAETTPSMQSAGQVDDVAISMADNGAGTPRLRHSGWNPVRFTRDSSQSPGFTERGATDSDDDGTTEAMSEEDFFHYLLDRIADQAEYLLDECGHLGTDQTPDVLLLPDDEHMVNFVANISERLEEIMVNFQTTTNDQIELTQVPQRQVLVYSLQSDPSYLAVTVSEPSAHCIPAQKTGRQPCHIIGADVNVTLKDCTSVTQTFRVHAIIDKTPALADNDHHNDDNTQGGGVTRDAQGVTTQGVTLENGVNVMNGGSAAQESVTITEYRMCSSSPAWSGFEFDNTGMILADCLDMIRRHDPELQQTCPTSDKSTNISRDEALWPRTWESTVVLMDHALRYPLNRRTIYMTLRDHFETQYRLPLSLAKLIISAAPRHVAIHNDAFSVHIEPIMHCSKHPRNGMAAESANRPVSCPTEHLKITYTGGIIVQSFGAA